MALLPVLPEKTKKYLIIKCSASFVEVVPCGRVKKRVKNISSGNRIMKKIVKLTTASLLEPCNQLAFSLFFNRQLISTI